jgi:DNA-binding ferritin-like protein
MKKTILFLVIAFIVIFILWKFDIIDAAIAWLGLFGIGASSVVTQRKNVKEKEKKTDEVLEDLEEIDKRYEKEVEECEEAVDDMSLDDLLDSANDRIRRNRARGDMEK